MRKRLSLPRRSRAGSLFILLCCLGLMACGLPSEPFLYPPERTTSSTEPSVLRFANPEDNNPDIFLGYLLVYRIFIKADAPANLAADGEDYLSTFVLSGFDVPNERGVNNGYALFKVINVPDGNKTDTFDVYLNFTDIINSYGGYPAFTDAIASFSEFQRKFKSSGDTNWTNLDFSNDAADYDGGDTDLPSEATGNPGEEYICAVWAVCYGFDVYDSFQNVYSEAEYIGQFEINLL